MKKRITSLLLVLAMCFAMLPTAAFAAENTQEPTEPQEPQETQDAETWGDKADTSWYVGHEADTKYHITTAEQLAGLAQLINKEGDSVTFAGKTVYLNNDLDLGGHEWISIGNGLRQENAWQVDPEGWYSFCGTFDGQHHVIYNLYSHDSLLDNDECFDGNIATSHGRDVYKTGLFGYLYKGTIKNLGIKNADIRIDPNDVSTYGEGILVDYIEDSTIENCWTTGSITGGSYFEQWIGGIVGNALGTCKISGCYSSAEIVGNYLGKGYNVPGGAVPMDFFDSLGGIAGGIPIYGTLDISDCWFDGKITVNSIQAAVGGIVGYADADTATVKNCMVVTKDIGRDSVTEEVNTCWVAYALGGTVENCYWPNDEKAYNPSPLEENQGTPVSSFASADVLTGLQTNAGTGIEWVAGINHPTFEWDDNNIPANYTKVDEAITAAKVFDSNLYSNYADVETAIGKVDRSKSKAEQDKVDAMAKTIEDAINALVRKSSGGGSSSPSYSVTIPNKTENGTVTVSPRSAEKGDTVTITAKPDSGYQLDDLTVTDKNGKELKLTDKGNGKYTFTMPASKVTVTPTFVKIAQQPTGKTFSDVAKSDWFADAVAYVTEKGLMNGTGRDTFSPNASTTRGMLMTVLARYAGADTTGGATWYEKGMNWAKANGVSDGTNPTVNITREQLVTMLYRYAGSPAANGSLDSFSDAASVSSYAVNAMQWAVANGIVNGSNGKLNPQNNATRAEVAAILMRFCEMNK